jgi:hypothetical protein
LHCSEHSFANILNDARWPFLAGGWNNEKQKRFDSWGTAPPRKGDLMMEILIISAIAGMSLGLRFKVFALVPMVFLATTVIVGSTATGGGLAADALMAFGAVASLEIGYLAGVILRGFVLLHLPSLYRHRNPLLNG